jgi:26S proteasome regulatory subunit N2
LADLPDFPEKQLACSVASKVLYHMEELDEALTLALRSGQKFNIMERSKYVDTLIAKCVDTYIV